MKPNLLSGIQPTGTPHIGNYLGALKQWVAMQEKYNCFFYVVDMHAITIDVDPKKLRQDSINAVKDLLAIGIDTEKSTICIQSHIPEHAELAWILNTITPISELERMTQFKDKSGILDVKELEKKLYEAMNNLNWEIEKFKKTSIESIAKKLARRIIALPKTVTNKVAELLNSEINPLEAILDTIDDYQEKLTHYKKHHKINTGLFSYPVLMAADILLYNAEVVPVGEDQLQHVELTRILAKKFNNKYGDYFKEPAAKITEAKRIMSLTDPNKKMSKSHGGANYIALDDEPDKIRKKIMKAVTDTEANPAEMSAGVRNLFDLLKYFSATKDHAKLLEQFDKGKLKYVDLKEATAEAVIKELKPVQEKRASISDKDVQNVIQKGYEKAKPIAEKTIKDVKEKIGFVGK